jgi:hypothetical protein
MKISYSKSQLKKVVDFIALNNKTFIGQYEIIRKTILKEMEVLANDPTLSYVGTMGFTLLSEYDEVDDHMMIDIIVDLSMSQDTFHEDDIASFEILDPEEAKEILN